VPDDFIAFLLALGRELPKKSVLLITHDTYLAQVARRASELAPYFCFTAPPWPILQRVMDKKVQCRTAQAQGVALPRTFFLDDTDLDEIEPDTLAWPAILKARFGKSFSRAVGRQVMVVNSMDEVRLGYETFGRFGLMLQEIIPGGDDQLYTFGSCLGRSGQILASFTGRKVRQHPAGFGTALVAESVSAPDLAEQGTRLLRALDFFGPSQVEFKLDPRDGRFKLVEINARFWKWHSLATACGANVAYAAYCDATGDVTSPQSASYCRRTWAMSLDDCIITGRRVLRGDYPWGSLREPYRSPFVDGVFSWRDPLPGLRFLWHTFGLGLSRLLRRLRALGSGQPVSGPLPTARPSETLARSQANAPSRSTGGSEPQ
jgi:predicted ATP-grasp superfamily ATP-dependent carboligase